MRLDFSGQRVMAVVAHPDDAECLCAGTLARAAADGAAIALCVLCRGDKGQPAQPIADLARVRRDEMAAAALLLGAELLEGDVPDGHLLDVPEQRAIVVELLRRWQPSLLLAHAPEDYHADHRAASALAEAASWFCTSRGHQTASPPMSTQPALWWMDTLEMLGFEPGFYIDVSDYVELKLQMLSCHESQLQRGKSGDFLPLQQVMLRQCVCRGQQAGVAAAEAFRIHRAWKRVRAW